MNNKKKILTEETLYNAELLEAILNIISLNKSIRLLLNLLVESKYEIVFPTSFLIISSELNPLSPHYHLKQTLNTGKNTLFQNMYHECA